MVYVDYLFEMTDRGIMFIDKDSPLEPNNMLKLENTPFNVGDCFVLTQTVNENILLRKTKQMFPVKKFPMQLELNFEKE